MPHRSESIAFCHSCGSPMDVSAVPPFSNVDCPSCGTQSRVKLDFGPYTLIRRHAQGGMSMVFVARDHTLHREVALKILGEGFSADERRIAAFEEEARITASFSHPNVVRVLTTGKAFGRFYIAMEFVPGGHFEQHINDRGKIPQTEMLPLAIEVAEGLKAAHAAGLIHRDVKPGNILLDAEGHAKIVDFGLALVTNGGTAQATEIWATPYYVPPETMEGHPEDFRSDIYAFGATLYHALAGKPPCGEETMSTPLLREAKKNVVPLGIAEPSLCADLCQIVDQAMAYQPAGRFSSYEELIRRLEAVLKQLKSDAPGATESSGSAARRRAHKKRRDRITLGAAGIAVLVAAAAGIGWVIRREAPPPEPKKLALTDTAPTVPESNTVTSTSATEIARNYREARAAVEARDFAKAAVELVKLRQNPAVHEPTRTWAGVEAVAAAFLDRNFNGAMHIARDTAAHAQAVEEESRRVSGELIRVLEKLQRPGQILFTDEPDGDEAARLMGAMIAGLRNWEQGLTAQAVENFTTVASVELGANDQWLEIYQNLAADYLADGRALSAPEFKQLPESPAACEVAIAQLETLRPLLKTRGRAPSFLRARQLYLKRYAKVLETRQATPDPPPAAWDTAAVMTKLAEFTNECEFSQAAAYLRQLPAEPGAAAAARTSLITVNEAAAVFLSDLEKDLAPNAVTGEFPLKSGGLVRKAALEPAGSIVVTGATGPSRPAQWADFSPDALIAMHRIFVKKPATEVERLRRHEGAISYDWLAGNRSRALSAAAVLSQGSSPFKQRWATIASGLPE